MPTNKHAAFRYRVLNACFTRPGRRRWTHQELLEEVNRQLQEHFGGSTSVGLRTISGDIALMRSDPPRGFGAPIEVRSGQYFYADPDFSIHHLPVSTEELHLLRDAFALLRQFPGLPQLQALERLLERDYAGQGASLPDHSIIQFESSPPAQGLSWLAPLYESIRRQEALRIRYRPFSPPEEVEVVLHPYLLKEWRNRWYVVGRNDKENQIWNLALDRIQAIDSVGISFRPNDLFDPETWYRDMVGVTRPRGAEPEEVRFRAAHAVAGYFITKPVHASQKILAQDEHGVTFSLRVIRNPEVLSEIRRFGEHVWVDI